MSKKLLASEVIVIDDKFIDDVKSRLNDNDAKPEDDGSEKYLSVRDVANRTNSSETTIRRHINTGMLKAKKITKSWLISEEDFKIYHQGK